MRYARLAFTLTLLALGLVAAPPAEAQTVPCKSAKLTAQTVGTVAANFVSGTAGTANANGGGRFNSTGQLLGRLYLTVCQSKETVSTTAQLRISIAGIYSPAMAWGDCVSYPITDGIVPQLISTEASTKAVVFECSATP